MPKFLINRLREFFHRRGDEPSKEKAGDQRSHTRYRSYARVKFRELIGRECLLKDISVTGCRVECTSLADIQVDADYILEVIPEPHSKIGHFEIEVKAVWINPAGYSGEVGFHITASPKGRLFQRYVDYLSWQGNRRQGE
jgi:hypothetical protein